MFSSIGALFGRGASSSSTTLVPGPGGFQRKSSTASDAGSGYRHDLHGDGDGIDIEASSVGSYAPSYPPRGGAAAGNGIDGLHPSRSPVDSVLSLSASAPRVKHTLARIRASVRKVRPELVDTLSYPASKHSLAELQEALREYVVPRDVVEAYQTYDGQDSYSVPRNGGNEETEGNQGFIYGLWWMTIEEILEEYQFWRRLDISTPPSPVAQKRINTPFSGGHDGAASNKGKGKGRQNTHTAKAPSTDAFLFGSEMDPRTVRGRMRSCPHGFTREEYSHPTWLPLLKDGYGNYIGVDLDPPELAYDQLPQPPPGVPRILPGRGQVVAFGREIDVKTVLWNGWADASAHDANVGGGWARFLAAYADDLAASMKRAEDARYRLNNSRYSSRQDDDDDDENDYRAASGGRQEFSTGSRRSQGLDWMDQSPAYSGLGTIEALVERSKRHWAQLGMYEPDAEHGYDDEGGQREDPLDGTPRGRAFSGSASKAGHGLDRPSKPSPLVLQTEGLDQPQNSRVLLAHSQSSQGGEGQPNPSTDTAQDALFSAAPTASPSERTPQSGMSHQALIQSDETEEDLQGQKSASALISPLHLAPNPASPEPSLILSPPSPKDASVVFQSFHDNTPVDQQDSSSQTENRSAPSPTPGGLQSPARFSPAQAQRYVERQSERERQRTYSQDSTGNPWTHSQDRRAVRKPPPPPAMPLGLPTLEFGNGIWHREDTSSYDQPKDSFEVIVDRR